MLKYFLIVLVLSISAETFSQTAWTVENIPNPKTSYNGFVSNPDQVLDERSVGYINTLLQALEDSTTVQVAVVVVNSIGDAVPGDFRTKLFRYWGVGQKDNNNGLLILMVMDQRRVEFETGYGLEPILTDAMCKRIQIEQMVPLLKEGNYSEAVLGGVREVIKILMNPDYREEVFAYSTENYMERPWWRKDASSVGVVAFIFVYLISLLVSIGSRKTRLKSAPQYIKKYNNPVYNNTKVALLNIGLPAAFFASQLFSGSLRLFEFALFVYALFAILLFEKRMRLNKYILKDNESSEPQIMYNALAKSNRNGWGAAAFFFPLPFLFYALFNKRRLFGLRNTPPVADDGITPMIKLGEVEDDEFLKAYQLKEENLKSIDYDVWKDPHSDHVKIYGFENFFSKYDKCPQCKSKTYLMIKNQTIHAASYDSSGEGMKTFNCKNCNYTKKETYTIARLTRSSSSSGSYSGGGGGGGSFGGGSSGGGGAGSSW
jgi:uncharacterized protein